MKNKKTDLRPIPIRGFIAGIFGITGYKCPEGKYESKSVLVGGKAFSLEAAWQNVLAHIRQKHRDEK